MNRTTVATIAIVGVLSAFAVTLSDLGHIAGAQADDPTAPEAASSTELHAVGIYEGYIKSGGQIHGSRADVVVDRPGKQVILSLGAYTATTWLVEAKPDTTIIKVILAGHDRQVVKGLPAGTVTINAFRDGSDRVVLPYAYDQEDPDFRKMVKALSEETGTELSSFHGAYEARAGMPFIIDAVDQGETKARLAPDYPQPTPVAALPEVSYSALLRQGSTTLFGSFTQAGPVMDSMLPAPKGAADIAFDRDRKRYYVIQGDGVVEVDSATGAETRLDLGMDVPGLSWPCGITFDTARHRVLLASLGGEGFLYAYDLATRAWSVVASMNDVDLSALTYDAKGDVLYGLAGRGNRVQIKKFTADGQFVEDIPLGDPIMPGMVSGRPGGTGTQLVAAGEYLVLIADEIDEDRKVTTRTFFIDADTGKAMLARVD